MTDARAGCGTSNADDPRRAAEQACAAALAAAGCERAEAALLFATPDHAEGLRDVLDAAASTLGTSRIGGATTHGVLAGGFEHEGGPALGVLALAGADADPFLLTDLGNEEARAGAEIAARLGTPGENDLVVLLPDPYALAQEPLLAGLRKSLAPAVLVGAGAVDGAGSPPLQWSDGRIATGALSGLILRGVRPPRIGVTQSCRPVCQTRRVSRTQGNWILEIDGRPALDVYREVVRGPLAEDLRRALSFVLVVLPRADASLAPGSYVVRNVAGFDPGAKAFAVADRMVPGDAIAFALREPAGAREDMKQMLEGLGSAPATLGLYLDCCARGTSLFGVSGLEAGYLRGHLGDTPHLGVMGAFEIGPIAGRAELLTYTGVLALLDL